MARGGAWTWRGRRGRGRGGPSGSRLGIRSGGVDCHRDFPSHDTRSRNSPSNDTRSRGSPSHDTRSRDSPSRDVRNRDSPSHGTRSRGSPSPIDIYEVPVPHQPDSPQDTDDPSEEYSAATPSDEDLNNEILRLNEENARLREELDRSQDAAARARGFMDHQVRMNQERQAKIDALTEENNGIRAVNHTLQWQNVELEWERRILARTWRVRLGDRSRYIRGAVLEYLSQIRDYAVGWAHLIQQRPAIGFLWRYRPAEDYEAAMRGYHYPIDLPH